MANLLDRFRKDVVGSQETDADYLPKIASNGDFERIKNLNAIINSWNNILLTPKRSYPYDPLYGSDLYKLIFEPADEITAERIEEEVISALQFYDNRAFIENNEITFLRNGKGFTVDIYVNYKGERGTLSVAITEEVFAGFITAEG
ncbi:MAG: hypothetical protein PVG65_00405 [Candidatus Thorarchaeota archaeon]|jgi:phage baseplate assembly protein W